ncbi:MAG TPA: Gfo/Idh/MocA family oxidoreductase, partial [Candidatus Hydrogenedentes bacterium]|nr:Gfo/Idh/MocA family oxidoreductase [Candidatus Hydrogenedentota bacterium]
MKHQNLTRRAFIATSTLAASQLGCATAQTRIAMNDAQVVPGKISPNERLNVAAIGAGGKGFSDIMSCKGENIVALCDVDWKRCEKAFNELPDARRFRDYRNMLEQMPEIDAVTISAPDHIHAPAAILAMKMGKHVYVQKPLTHTVQE